MIKSYYLFFISKMQLLLLENIDIMIINENDPLDIELMNVRKELIDVRIKLLEVRREKAELEKELLNIIYNN